MGNQTEITKTLYEEIRQLYLKCYQDSSPHIIHFDNASNYIMQLLATCEVTIVWRKTKLVGCIVYQKFHNTLLNDDEIFIHEWFIHPNWRKKLVGKQLYDAIVEIGKEKKCKRLRGISSNSQMIDVIQTREEAKTVALMFEKEL
jgi:hypothetical protein